MGIVVLDVEGGDDNGHRWVESGGAAAGRQDPTEAHDKQTSNDKEMNDLACLYFSSLVSCWTPRFCWYILS